MAVEKKSIGHAYNIDFLNVVFAASSIVLFVCTVWMVWDDFDREWKHTQRRFTQLEMEVTRQQLAAVEMEGSHCLNFAICRSGGVPGKCEYE